MVTMEAEVQETTLEVEEAELGLQAVMLPQVLLVQEDKVFI